MATFKVNPNRMEVLRLRKRLVLCRRGHRLLKQKQDELMRILTKLMDEVKNMRKGIEEKLINAFRLFLLADAHLGEDYMESIIAFIQVKIQVELEEKRLLNLRIPELNVKVEGNIHDYGLLWTNSDLDMGLNMFSEVIPELLKLSEAERKLFIIAEEVESTRRRVNALEYKLIPDLQETIKFITMKLDENERAGIVRLMKVKDIVRSH